MRLEDMEVLVRAMDAHSMTKAARQLHRTPASVSAIVQRSEKELGLKLFERTTRSMRVTSEGLTIIESCREILARWQETLLEARSEQSDLRGDVRVSAPADTSEQVLAPLVAEFASAHPLVNVTLEASDSIVHLQQEAIDIAIRFGELRDSSLSARRLASAPIVLVASPRYLSESGTPRRPRDLSKHRCLTLRLRGAEERSWTLVSRSEKKHQIGLSNTLCGNGLLVRKWALDDRGIARKSLLDVIDDLQRGDLVRVLPEYRGPVTSMHLVYPSRRVQPARTRALADAIAAELKALESRCESWLRVREGQAPNRDNHRRSGQR